MGMKKNLRRVFAMRFQDILWLARSQACEEKEVGVLFLKLSATLISILSLHHPQQYEVHSSLQVMTALKQGKECL